MPKKKVAVALSEGLLAEADEYAARVELSRSALVEEATAEYLARRRNAEDAEKYRHDAEEAFADMLAFAKERAADGSDESEPSSLEILRSLRGTAQGSGS